MTVKKVRVLQTILALTGLSLLVVNLWWASKPEKAFGAMVPVSLADYDFGKKARKQWLLPRALREISGLAIVDNDRILIHEDETAVVFEFRISTQQVKPLFQLDQPVLKLDLEGIAILGRDIYLVTSTGQIYKVANGLERTGVIEDYQVFDPGLESVCEVEALDKDLNETALVLVCKRMLEAGADYVSLYRYTPGAARAEKLFDLAFADLKPIGTRRIHPSGISIQFDSYIILAGKERLIVQVSKEGEIVSSAKLKKKYHRQSEGIGFLPDHTLVISDEGRYRGGRVTTYKLGL